MWIYLVHRIDKGLCILPTEMSNQLEPIVFGEDGSNQRNALLCPESGADQPLPGRRITARKKTVRVNTCMIRKRGEHSRVAQNFQHLRDVRARVRVLVPATLHQFPQLICEGWMRRPWGTPALHDREGGCGSRKVIERNNASEGLC